VARVNGHIELSHKKKKIQLHVQEIVHEVLLFCCSMLFLDYICCCAILIADKLYRYRRKSLTVTSFTALVSVSLSGKLNKCCQSINVITCKCWGTWSMKYAVCTVFKFGNVFLVHGIKQMCNFSFLCQKSNPLISYKLCVTCSSLLYCNQSMQGFRHQASLNIWY